MEAVVSSVISAAIQVVFHHITPNQKFLLSFLPGNRKLELKRLEKALQTISVVLEDAENKQESSPAVKTWFNSLKHSVYQAEDLVDEINTERMRINMHHSKGNLSDTGFSDQFIKELSPRLQKICDELESFGSQIGVLGLEIFYGKQKREDKLPSTSLVIQSQIFGRDDEKEKIIQMALSGEGATDVSVIPITGMGGMGKTTLAQLVYNDKKVKDHFEIRAWVCVSEEFDIYRVTKDVLMEVNSVIVDEKDDLNRLQVKLKDNLERKRFIIIFDDIWNDNYNDCQRLMTPLYSGSRGSKIIVTTRNENIARMLQNEHSHPLRPIPDDQSWSLFKLHAFDNRTLTLPNEFETVGRIIVGKCKGLPLAIKTLAGALRSKDDIREWRDISSSDNWMIVGDILPALSLSYKLLPSHLKCCFAFCAVFPKDVPLDKEEVALLWMANDLVQPSSQKVAQNYFDELRSRSFFEMGNDNKYVMHDFINDLARHVSGNFCARIENYQFKDLHGGIEIDNDLPPEVLHFSYLTSGYSTSKKFREVALVRGLRTFLPVYQSRNIQDSISELFCIDILPKLRHIRALSLHQYDISVIPDSIGNLKHLRFLNLAQSHIRKLPNDITKCLNLQTLILRDCSELEELPEDIGVLINLQHLDIRGVGFNIIAKMEFWLSKLKDIKNVSVVVNEIHGGALELLDKLQFREGLLISELDNTVTVEMVKNAELKNRNYIEYLGFEWSGIPECSENELKIFAELIPHTNITALSINRYRGTTFSDWLGDSSFCNIKFLCLEDCKNCFQLPPLGQLTGLQGLEISGMDGITEVGEEFYGSSSICTPFPVLDYLSIRNMPEWTTWSMHPDNIDNIPAPNLKRIYVSSCTKLKSLPEQMLTQLSSLTVLNISDCPEMECFLDGDLPLSLETLSIARCKKLLKFPRNWGLQRLRSLIDLSITGIEENLFPEEALLPASLQSLSIRGCPNLEALNHKGFQDITSLKFLLIDECPELRYLPEDGLPSSLSKLHLYCCPELRYLPKDGLPSSVSELNLYQCPKLKVRRDEKGVVRLSKVLT